MTFLVSLALCAFAQTAPPTSPDSGKDAASGEVFKVGHGVSVPKAIYQPDPEYSEKARKKKFQGVCVLSLVVGADGKTRDIKVVRPLGMGLDEQAIKAVTQWKFEPALKDGQPVAVQIAVEVNFRIR
jgi:periplasmic protein TonB